VEIRWGVGAGLCIIGVIPQLATSSVIPRWEGRINNTNADA
jgi:hypothetical protein